MKIYNLESIGFWSHEYENGVTPSFLIGSYEDNLKENILKYLKSCPGNGIELGYARCRFECPYSYTSEMGARVQTDGKWLWPEGLTHYVERHNLLLPDSFINHIKMLNYCTPDVDELLIQNLCLNECSGIEINESQNEWIKWLENKGEKDYLKQPIIVTPCSPEDRIMKKSAKDDNWWTRFENL